MRSRRTVGIFDGFLERDNSLEIWHETENVTPWIFFFPKLSSVFSNGYNDKNERQTLLSCMAQPLQEG